MFRVPVDPNNPSFDRTEKIGFLRWLMSTRAERLEWSWRRQRAAERAQRDQRLAVEKWRRDRLNKISERFNEDGN